MKNIKPNNQLLTGTSAPDVTSPEAPASENSELNGYGRAANRGSPSFGFQGAERYRPDKECGSAEVQPLGPDAPNQVPDFHLAKDATSARTGQH